jgi:murein L,D-transpeptidase YafK
VDFNQYGSRIFTLDYPNYFDTLEKKTGNGIWLHSIPESKSLLRGSRGCVVVRNNVIQELSKYIDLKQTPIVIVGTVEYLTEADWLAQQEKMKSWLEAWRVAWGGKDLDTYMSKYSERFRSAGMNKRQWRRFKANLADKYSFINVALRDVQIFNIGPKLVFRFMQEYKSNLKEDAGTKILYMLKNGEKYEIIGENWQQKNPATTTRLGDVQSGDIPPRRGAATTTTSPAAGGI